MSRPHLTIADLDDVRDQARSEAESAARMPQSFEWLMVVIAAIDLVAICKVIAWAW